MPRKLSSVEGGTGFRESVEVDDAVLEALVDCLDRASEPPNRNIARGQLRVALEDFQAGRAHDVSAKTVRQDQSDAKRLRKFVASGVPTEAVTLALEALTSFEAENPVLARRLWWRFNRKRYSDLRRALEGAEDLLAFASREMTQLDVDLGHLTESLSGEHGRGPTQDDAAMEFTHTVYLIWKQFSSKGTSRHSGRGREKFPFGDFVRRAGRLIDPAFNGHYHARRVHDDVRGTSGDK